MSILNLNAPQGRAPRNKKATKVWLGVGLLVAVLGIGTTFAASIVLNGGSPTESGQGVQSIVFCGNYGNYSSQTITATPFSSYKNKAGDNATFNLTGIKITGISKACDNTDFIVSVYPAGNDSSPTGALQMTGPASTGGMTLANVLWFDGNTSQYYPKVTNGSSLSSGCDFNPFSSIGSSPYPNKNLNATNVTNNGAFMSLSRSTYASACTYAYISAVSADTGGSSTGNGSFTITFNPNSSWYSAKSSDLSKIVVETQNDVLAGTVLKPCNKSGSTFDCTSLYAGLYGLSWATS
jgi:hypothetical protein